MGDDTTGGIPVATSDRPGALVSQPGQLQYGDTLMGVGTSAGWRELVGWRDLPDASVGDSDRPQSHGAYAGAVYGGSLVVTFTCLLRGLPGDKLAALNAFERATRMDGVDRPLVVNDGDGPWLRLARVIGRSVPQGQWFSHAPLECSVQLLCADPRRYAVAVSEGTARLPFSEGGLTYPLAYPLDYGTAYSGTFHADHQGTVDTPLQVRFQGPLTDPVLVVGDRRLAFTINLADGETLTVDTNDGTVLLNDSADRLYTLRNDSDPLQRCNLPPGETSLNLGAAAGSGTATVSYRDARL